MNPVRCPTSIEFRVESFTFNPKSKVKESENLFPAELCNAIKDDDIYTCCSSSNQCGANQGDCDSDNDCSGSLVCGEDNCQPPFPIDADCCTGKFSFFLIRSSMAMEEKKL